MIYGARNIRDVLERAVERNPDKIFLLFNEEEIIYREFDINVNRTGNMFLQLGITKGDRVALMLPNCIEFLYIWLGLAKVGASIVPINTSYREKECAYLLKHSEAKAIVASPQYWPILTNAIEQEAINIGLRVSVGGYFSDTLSYEQSMTQYETTLRHIDIDIEDEAAILYTSGTTGNPKGCIHSQEYYLQNGYRYSKHLGLTANDRVLNPLPLFHMNPQILTTMGTLFVGGSMVLVDRFHPSTWWRELREKGANFFHYLGVMPAMLMGFPAQADDADHPLWIGLGAGVPKTLHQQFEKRFNVVLLEVFGMTETGLNFAGDARDVNRQIGNCCFHTPFPEFEAKVVDDHDHEVPGGVTGELVLRSSNAQNRKQGFMLGYYKDPGATTEAWKNGWFHTGDYVMKDGEGRYYFVDRKKDIVRRSGENISASEVEGAIHTHPAVMEVAVIPVPDLIREQEVKAYIVFKEGFSLESVSVSELIKWAEERLAYFKVPRYWEFRSNLPITQTGKIQKQKLKSEKLDLTAGSFDRVLNKWLTE